MALPKVKIGRKKTLADSANAFLRDRQALPLWALAGAFAVYCFSFVTTFWSNYPAEEAYFGEQNLVFHRSLADGEDILHLLDVLEAAYGSVKTAEESYVETFGGKNVGDPLDQEKLTRGAALIRDAKSKIGVADAALSSVNFADAEFNTTAVAMKSDIDFAGKTMAAMEHLYSAAQIKDMGAISQATSEFRSNQDQVSTAKEALIDHWKHFRDAGDRFYAESQIRVEKAHRQIIFFRLQEWLSYLAILYLLGFVVKSVFAFRKYRRSNPR